MIAARRVDPSGWARGRSVKTVTKAETQPVESVEGGEIVTP